jgi:hypothetical protein
MEKKYGNNYKIKFCNKYYVIGLKRNMNLVIYMTLYFIILFIFYIIMFKNFYNIFLFIFGFIFLFATIYNYLLSFLLEPGIIPRNINKNNLNFNTNSNLNNNNNSNLNNNNNNNINLNLNLENNNNSAELEMFDNNNSERINENNRSFYIKKKKTIDIIPDFLQQTNHSINNNVISINDDLDTYLDSYKNEKKRIKKEILKNNNSLIFDANTLNSINNINNHNNHNLTELNNPLKYLAYKNSKLNKYINLNDSIPYIFQKKQCLTCNIERPKKCSHCKICDNCVLEMDHHCFYISNCVGIRNHKNFFLFLFFGSFLSFIFLIFNVYHIIFVYCLYDFNLTKILIKKFKILFYFGNFLMFFPTIFLYLIFRKYLMSIIIYLIGSFIEIFIFIENKKKLDDENKIKIKNLNFYHNFSLLMFIGLFPITIFVNSAFWKQVKIIGKGLTIKQYSSIIIQRDNLKKEGNEKYKNMEIFLNKKWNIGFLINKICRKRKKSLINL